MSRSLFIASPEAKSGKSMVAYGLLDLLTRWVGRVGVFCPVTDALEAVDPVVHLLLSHPAVDQPYDSAIGVAITPCTRISMPRCRASSTGSAGCPPATTRWW
jgi:BioD-like phosphotransacetylase family protein